MANRGLSHIAGMWMLIALSGCSRDTHTMPLAAPFDARTTLGEVHATWKNSGEERAFAQAVRLKEPEVRFQYRVDVDNRSGDKLFVRLGDFQLLGPDGLEVGKDTVRIDCTLAAGKAPGVLAGEVWVPRAHADKIGGFRATAFAVPLGERGRTRYRDWLLRGQPDNTAEVDAELARYAAATECTAHGE